MRMRMRDSFQVLLATRRASVPRPSLRRGKSAITREEWRRRTQSQHEVSALRERPHQVETLGGKSVAAEEQGRSICRGGRTRGPEGHRPQGPSLGCTRQRRRRETGSYSARYGKRSSLARTTALEGVPCAGAGSTQTSGSRSAARAGRARRRARRETVGAARPGNRRAPACATSEGDWRAFRGGARELERRGQTLATGRGC